MTTPPLPEPKAPNAEGETPCIVRWMVETPAGWLGAHDRAAFDAYAAQCVAVAQPNLACKSVQARLAAQWGYVTRAAAAAEDGCNSLAQTLAAIARYRDALRDLANAADAVGVRHFDSDDLPPEVEALQFATAAARLALGPTTKLNGRQRRDQL